MAAVLALLLPTPAAEAWTREAQLTIAREAAHLAPPDLARQIAKHEKQFEKGVLAPFGDRDPRRRERNPDGSGLLDRVIAAEVAQTIEMIEAHRPFSEIVWRMGVISHYVAQASNPLAAANSDRAESRYARDFSNYLESALPRCPLVFYGRASAPLERGGAPALVNRALQRSRELYPLVGKEYRRIEFGSGRAQFDDRSTAFALSSLSFSRAVNDVMLTLRYAWIAAGGDDPRGLPAEGQRVLKLPRVTLAK